MVRAAIAVAVAGVSWMVAFLALAMLLATVWPDYALHGQIWFSAQRFEFTPLEAWFNILFWVLAEMFAGWLVVALAKRREPSWVLAALIGSYLAVTHLYLEWDTFPWWYNVAVALPPVFAVLAGAGFASRFVRRDAAVTV